MKVSSILSFVVLALASSSIHGFVAPSSGRSGIVLAFPTAASSIIIKKAVGPLAASLAEEGDAYDPNDNTMDDMDAAWSQFQEVKSAKQISLSEFGPPRDDLFDPKKEEEINAQRQLGMMLSLLTAVTCLVAIYFSGQSPHFVPEDNYLSSSLDDVDTAQGRFHALTGGVWF